jgi:hypothetical protein
MNKIIGIEKCMFAAKKIPQTNKTVKIIIG